MLHPPEDNKHPVTNIRSHGHCLKLNPAQQELCHSLDGKLSSYKKSQNLYKHSELDNFFELRCYKAGESVRKFG